MRFLLLLTILTCGFHAHAYRIMLDPGHGGVDTGAVRGAAREADLVLKVAMQLKKLLESDSQFQVSLTRTTNTLLTLPERVKKAEAAKADLFVSLHANASTDSRAKGLEFYFQNALPPDEESLFLASVENQNLKESATPEKVETSEEPSKKGDVAAILEDLHRQQRIASSLALTEVLSKVWEKESAHDKISIKQAPFYVISKTNMPAVLIEIGFISNAVDVKKLMTAQYQLEVAQKIHNALVAYKEKGDKENPVGHSGVE